MVLGTCCPKKFHGDLRDHPECCCPEMFNNQNSPTFVFYIMGLQVRFGLGEGLKVKWVSLLSFLTNLLPDITNYNFRSVNSASDWPLITPCLPSPWEGKKKKQTGIMALLCSSQMQEKWPEFLIVCRDSGFFWNYC